MSLSSIAAAPQSLSASSTPRNPPFQSPRLRTLLGCLILAVVVLLSYNPVTHNGFIGYDDDGYITDNPHVKAGLTRATVKWAFTTYEQANWHPLTWLSHALDYQLFGQNPAGHHYVNVLLHAFNAVLLFLLLQSATGFPWRSLMVAALFALHPINVESVAWAAERKNVLSMAFFLLALCAYVSYTRRPALHRYALLAGAFVLALLTKPQVITFPFLLCLLDYWPLGRIGAPLASAPATQTPSSARISRAGLVLEKLPLLLLSAASAVMTMKAQRAGNAVQTLSQYSFLLRAETAVISYVRYLGKAVWPSHLVALYPHPTKLYPVWQFAGAAVLLALITVLVLRARGQKYLFVGWFWFLGSLVPMIGLVQVGVQAMADRYAYIPFIGLFLMATWLAADVSKARWVVVPALACLLMLGLLTYRQVGYWHDTQAFWQRTLEFTSNNYVAETKLGEFLFSQHKDDEAASHFRAALAIRPDGLTANLNLGAYEDRRGNRTAAIERYQMVADHAGDIGLRATAYGSLGFVYRQQGDSRKARECFEIALQLAPDRSRAMVGLGLIAQDNGNLSEAIRHYSQAVAAQPTDVSYLLLAQALLRAGGASQANAIYEQLSHHPGLSQAQKDAEELLSQR